MLRRLLASLLAPAAATALVLLLPGALRELAAEPGAQLLVAVLEASGWVLPVLVAVLAWRHDRSRLVFGALLVAAAAFASTSADSGLDAADRLTGLSLLVAVGAGFLVIAPLEERGLFTRVGFPRLLAFGAALGGLGWVLRERSDWIVWALEPLGAAARPWGHGPWSPLALGLAVAAGATCLLARRRDRAEVGAALLFALASTLAGLTAAHGGSPDLALPLAPTAFFVAAAFVLAQGLHALAWRHGHLDELTGLPSRRALEERLPKLSGTYSVAVLDLDHFKRVNDQHGHEAGDTVLQALADRLRRFAGGTVFRSGGEEFVAILPGLSLDQAEPRLEALREEIAGLNITVPPLPGRQPKTLRVTVSIGAAQRTRRDPSPERVIAAADAALLRAKKTGRNRVSLERRTASRRSRRRSGTGSRNA